MRAPSLHRGTRPPRSSSPLVKREHFLARCLHAFWTRASKPKTDLRVPEREPRRPSAPDRPDARDVDGNALVPPRRDGAPGAPEVGGRPPPAAVLSRAGVPARAAARPRPAPRAGPPHDHDRPRDPPGAGVRGPPAGDTGHEVPPLFFCFIASAKRSRPTPVWLRSCAIPGGACDEDQNQGGADGGQEGDEDGCAEALGGEAPQCLRSEALAAVRRVPCANRLRDPV